MGRTILVAWDGSEQAEHGLRFALTRLTSPGDRVVLGLGLGVQLYEPFLVETEEADLHRLIATRREALERATTRVAEEWPDVSIEGRLLEEREVVPALLGAADELDAAVIVAGTHGREGLEHFLMGSVAERLVRDAKRPVLVLRKPSPEPKGTDPRRVVACVALAEHPEIDALVIRHASELAARFGASLDVLHILNPDLVEPFAVFAEDIDPPAVSVGERVRGRRAIEIRSLVESLDGLEVNPRMVVNHDVAQAICAEAEGRAAEIVVMGSHREQGIARLFGTVARRVARHAPTPVLFLHPDDPGRHGPWNG